MKIIDASRALRLLTVLMCLTGFVACKREHVPVTRTSDANDESGPPVNAPRTDPSLKPTNVITAPATNVTK